MNSSINITLQQALQRASVPLQRKMMHSIELLQKSERLALRYDNEDGFFLAFSGGKDSQALYHIAKLAGVKFRAHINFTSVDPPQLVRFVKQQYPDCICHAPKKSIYDLAVDRGILPSMRIRWCCADLKEQAGAGKVTLIGIRKQESVRRAKRHEVEVSDRRFSGNLDEFYQWQKAELEKREEKLLKKIQKEGKKVNEDEFSMMKEREVRCINGKDSILVSPIFEWSEQDVWYFLNEVVKVPHCQLYDQGYHRIGCILCPMSSHKQKLRELKDFPHVKHRWLEAIKEIRRGVSQGECTACHSQKFGNRYGGVFYLNQFWENSRFGVGRTDGQWQSDNQPCKCSSRTLEPQNQQRHVGGFSDSPSLNGNRGGKTTCTSRPKMR